MEAAAALWKGIRPPGYSRLRAPSQRFDPKRPLFRVVGSSRPFQARFLNHFPCFRDMSLARNAMSSLLRGYNGRDNAGELVLARAVFN